MAQRKLLKGKILKYIELNENKNKTYQNFGDASKTVLKGKFIILNAYIRKDKRSQIEIISSSLKKLEKKKAK